MARTFSWVYLYNRLHSASPHFTIDLVFPLRWLEGSAEDDLRDEYLEIRGPLSPDFKEFTWRVYWLGEIIVSYAPTSKSPPPLSSVSLELYVPNRGYQFAASCAVSGCWFPKSQMQIGWRFVTRRILFSQSSGLYSCLLLPNFITQFPWIRRPFQLWERCWWSLKSCRRLWQGYFLQKPLHDVQIYNASSSRSASCSSSPSTSGCHKRSYAKGKRKVAFGSTEAAKEDKGQTNLNNLLLKPKCT